MDLDDRLLATTGSLAVLGLAIVCDTCESEIDLMDDAAERGVCRHCGMAFLLDDPMSDPVSDAVSDPMSDAVSGVARTA